jgi:hypothetical protein
VREEFADARQCSSAAAKHERLAFCDSRPTCLSVVAEAANRKSILPDDVNRPLFELLVTCTIPTSARSPEREYRTCAPSSRMMPRAVWLAPVVTLHMRPSERARVSQLSTGSIPRAAIGTTDRHASRLAGSRHLAEWATLPWLSPTAARQRSRRRSAAAPSSACVASVRSL